MQRCEFNHFYEMAVRWSDLDALGHVNNVLFARYLESGRVAYCEEILGIQFGPQLKAGWILADITCTFYHQLQYPDTIEVATRINALGNSSAHLNAAIFRRHEDQPALVSKGVFVWFDYEKQKSLKIPESVRRKIAEVEKIR